jgi:hypothetical protein
MITVIINDLVSERRTAILLDINDFQKIDSQWYEKDKLLVDLAKTNINFKNRTHWFELTPILFRLLIEKNIEKAAKLSTEEQNDKNNPVMVSLVFLLTGLVKSFGILTDSTLDLIRINRISKNEVLYDYTGSMSDFASLKRPEKTPLKVVVDNA